jgi:hypothetical protein
MDEKPKENWGSGGPYEQYVGRWSRKVAKEFLAWLARISHETVSVGDTSPEKRVLGNKRNTGNGGTSKNRGTGKSCVGQMGVGASAFWLPGKISPWAGFRPPSHLASIQIGRG